MRPLAWNSFFMLVLPPLGRIDRFYFLTWLLVAIHVSTFTTGSQYSSVSLATWTLMTTVTYSFFYMLPALVGGYLVRWLMGKSRHHRVAGATVALAVVGLTGVTHVLLFSDRS